MMRDSDGRILGVEARWYNQVSDAITMDSDDRILGVEASCLA